MQFLMSGTGIERTNYEDLFKEVCAKEHVELTSAKRSIQRFINNDWKQGFQCRWKKYTGWIEPQPPDADTAIRLILQS
ncbi:hypothetical protein [Pseudoflavonifractor sp. 524-17]|uniref:hypothetical protein n=1 Tax=Pseudoflavonifractor sp. 524-17 TaxID=2304577 RepID=UPI00137A8B38|nr:hypothetical protein [Pseudoflavonifractor sp. 524-17]